MLESLATTCDRCDDPLSADEYAIEFATAAGTRRVYECGCGAITITVVGEGRSDR